jgi:hypothetical protein
MRLTNRKGDSREVHHAFSKIALRDGNGRTHPWTVDKRYVHESNPHPEWRESSCVEGSDLVALGKEMYLLRADGLLMPAKKDQRPTDLRYFKQLTK